ncbi:hypothetical protein MJ1HA_0961 [Metallosphaera sedula]|nr:hypothetical protein MJ1HA_0961 [Metallosphaera sedula]
MPDPAQEIQEGNLFRCIKELGPLSGVLVCEAELQQDYLILLDVSGVLKLTN